MGLRGLRAVLFVAALLPTHSADFSQIFRHERRSSAGNVMGGVPMPGMNLDSSTTGGLLERAAKGDAEAFRQLFDRHGPALRKLVRLRVGRELAGRIDVADVLQEAYLIAFRRLADFVRRRPMPFSLWLRRVALEQLVNLRRYHVQSSKRSVLRESPWPGQSAQVLARELLSRSDTPSEQLVHREETQRLEQGLAELGDADREILLMRYVERLSNREVALLLGISETAASKRHGGALLRLRKIMSRQHPGSDQV